ncbi:DNA polymerase IV [Rhodococcus ruber]|uniref:DNA polymerase IV n=1 Tax=Rhodococcus ruber TaxID=1830 RepID=UPI00315D7AF0
MFVSGLATILHADLDSFYASVEQRDDPRLRGRPVIVGGGGVVLAASYEAKAFGVATAMSGRGARALCPAAIVVPPRMHAYTRASRAVFAVFEQTTPLVEALSIDEAFLDVAGLWRIDGTPADIAARLRRDVAEQVGLPITVGVARTKFLAKVASGVAKPDGLLVVPPDRELEFLRPLPVERLWGIGRVTAATLHAHGLHRVADLARESEVELVALLGRSVGRHLHALAHGHDPRPVRPHRRRRSVGAQHALGRSRSAAGHDPGLVDATLRMLVERVTGRMRAAGRAGRTVVLRLRFADYSRATRSHTLRAPTARTDVVLGAARELLGLAQPLVSDRGLTLIGVAVSNLDSAGTEQLELPFDEPARDGAAAGHPALDRHALDAVLDDVHGRFGTRALTSASVLGRRPHPAVPLLPE